MLRVAADAIAGADIMLFALLSRGELPQTLTKWIEERLLHNATHRVSLLALLETGGMIVPRLSSAEICLSHLASEGRRGLLVLFRRHSARQNQLAAQGPALRRGSAPSLIMTTTTPQANARPGADAAQHKCAVCDKEIVDGNLVLQDFSRGEARSGVCSPRCALRYFDSLHPTSSGDELERAVCERSAHFLMNGETP